MIRTDEYFSLLTAAFPGFPRRICKNLNAWKYGNQKTNYTFIFYSVEINNWYKNEINNWYKNKIFLIRFHIKKIYRFTSI